MQLQDRVIVVTGAAGQLGRAVVAEAAARGARVVLLDVVEAAAPPGGRAWRVDLTALADTTRTFNEVAAHFGQIDALANVAGGFRWQTLAASDELAEFDTLYALNLRTCANACKAVLPHLLAAGRGCIVNVGAMGAVRAAAGMGAYAASKAGVMRLTEALADEVKLQGITVNAVLPGIIDTPQNRADMPAADFGRWVQTVEIARVIAFLVSDDAAAMTGALVPVTGKG